MKLQFSSHDNSYPAIDHSRTFKNTKQRLFFVKYWTRISISTLISWARERGAEESSICSQKSKHIFKFYNQNIAIVNLYCSLKVCAISSEGHWKGHFQPSVIWIRSKQSPKLWQLKSAYVVHEKKLKEANPPETNLVLHNISERDPWQMLTTAYKSKG